MLQLVAARRVGGVGILAEPGARYRRCYDRDGALSITGRAERKVMGEAPDVLQQVLSLAGQLRAELQSLPSAMSVWLELEECLHSYWREIAAAHYDLGVEQESGARRLAQAIQQSSDRDSLSFHQHLEAVAALLREIADSLSER